jgi:dolichyl-diphosphooligosaccharide--protein glycosyltransferase
MILSNERKKSRPSKKAKRSKQKAKEKRQEALVARFTRSRYAYGLIALIVVFFLAFYPNIGKSIEWASALRGPSEDWHATLVWMEENTTDPFGDDDFYYQLYGEGYDYAEPEYGVLSWWDYGYWITYIAHRIPNAHPGGGSRRSAGLFFTAQDESSANEVINGLSSKYVIIDIKMAREKFYSMIEWAEKDVDDFYEWYFIRISSGNLEPLKIYYPAYYRSMCSRLYNFEGRAIVPGNSTWVISYDERIDAEGNRYKEITDVANNGEPFTTYEEAEEYLELYGSSKHRIVGMKPLISPVPLEELKYYKLIYRSPTEVWIQGEQTVSEVEVFEYLPQDRMSIEPRAERLDSN